MYEHIVCGLWMGLYKAIIVKVLPPSQLVLIDYPLLMSPTARRSNLYYKAILGSSANRNDYENSILKALMYLLD